MKILGLGLGLMLFVIGISYLVTVGLTAIVMWALSLVGVDSSYSVWLIGFIVWIAVGVLKTIFGTTINYNTN